MNVDFEKLLDWITGHVYDEGHGLLPDTIWTLNAESLLDFLRDQTGLSKDQMREAFDRARVRVHGEGVDVS